MRRSGWLAHAARVAAAIAFLGALGVLGTRPSGTDARSARAAVNRPATAFLPPLTTFAQVSMTDPHGAYSVLSNLCRNCHTPHSAPGPRLHPYETEKETCYACHGGTGASANIRADFGEVVMGSSVRTSYHPVPAAKDGVQLACSDCHTPHWTGTEVTKQLRIREPGGTYSYSTPASPLGNSFCYSCHGAASTYPAPLGNHTAFDASIHNTAANVPNPPSGSQIKCLACHAPHGAATQRLGARWDLKTSPAPDPTVEKDQEALCYTCHTGTTNSSGGPDASSPPTDPYVAFTSGTNDYTTDDGDPVAIFHHPVTPADQAFGTRAVECASCHNSHIVDQTDSATTSKIVNPADVTQKWYVRWQVSASQWDMNQTSPWTDMVGFCESCHVDPTTMQPVTAGANVPYTVKMVNDTSSEAGRPHDSFSATSYNTSEKHGGGGAQLACTACHATHGSSNAFALKENVVSTADGVVARTVVTGFQNSAVAATPDTEKIWSFCRNCHYKADQPDTYPHNKGQYCLECHYHNGGDF